MRVGGQYTVEKGRKRKGKTDKETQREESFLEEVEIVPVSGSVYTAFTEGSMLGHYPASEGRLSILQSALSRRYGPEEIRSFR